MAQDERGAIVEILRQHAPVLRQQGVRGLVLFGSIARGEADHTSDIDLAGEFDTTNGFSLIDLVGVQHQLADLLRRPVDLVSLTSLKGEVRKQVEREAMRAF